MIANMLTERLMPVVAIALIACTGLAAQTPSVLTFSQACIDLNQTAVDQIVSGRFEQAERFLTAALAEESAGPQDLCRALILINMAGILSRSARAAEAERYTERSLALLEKAIPPGHPALLRPLQMLAAACLEQGKITKARDIYRRMQSIPIETPDHRALVHGVAGALRQAEGQTREAEAEYLEVIRACVESGRVATADGAAAFSFLAGVYVEERRYEDAQQAVDRALSIFSTAKDTAPEDLIKLLNLRGVLRARQGDWLEAERDIREAISITDRNPRIDSIVLQRLLVNYVETLRKNHRGRREVRAVEARQAALRSQRPPDAIVDVAELLTKKKVE